MEAVEYLAKHVPKPPMKQKWVEMEIARVRLEGDMDFLAAPEPSPETESSQKKGACASCPMGCGS